MSDLGVDAKKVSDHLSDIIAESVSFNEDFLQSKPINNWRVNLCKLDGFNGLGTAKKATDSYYSGLTRFCWGWGVDEEILSFVIFHFHEIELSVIGKNPIDTQMTQNLLCCAL